MSDREVMRLSDAEQWLLKRFGSVRGHHAWRDLIDAFNAGRAALEQPDVPEAGFGNMEPVAWWIPKAEQFCIKQPGERPFAKAWEPLYTHPPREWKGLTRSQIDYVMTQHYPLDSLLRENVDAFETCVRDIEQALKEKNQ